MKILALIVLLFATAVLSSAINKKAVAITSTSVREVFLSHLPSQCLSYLENLVKWQIIVKSQKDIEWIFIWANSSTCQVCVKPEITPSDVANCMKCLKPYENHIIKLPGCRDCFTETRTGLSVCKRCLSETIYVTESVTCTVESEVRRTMTLLKLGM
ncbi:hypothetical protein AAHC03_013881 [Spirometra sp. Aus1]